MAFKPGQSGNRRGRPTAHAEKANVEDLYRLWIDDTELAKIKAKVKSGTYSLRDMFVLKAAGGSETLLKEILKRVHPESLDLNASGEIRVIVTNYADNQPATPVQPSDEAVPAGRAAEPSKVQIAAYPPQGGQDSVGTQ